MKKFQPLLLAFLLPVMALAQTTTGSMTGVIQNDKEEKLVGASISATHIPTGTVYQAQTRTGGRFDIANMNPGGPYTIEVSYTGYNTQRHTDVYLSLGEAARQDFSLATKGEDIGIVVVGGKKSTNKDGILIDRTKIANLPAISRNISDLLRFTPQARVDNSGGISIAGQNNRFNSFYIDGAPNNDAFGLSSAGTNGGQTGTPPISIDAIDQFQVSISPYDASLGNFTGGSINAVTRSGTNNVEGSVYYLFRNQDLAGKTPGVPKEQAKKLNNSMAQTVGFRVGGPIIKNKLFYFLNAEIQRENRAQPFEFGRYQGTLKQTDLDTLRNKLATYGYDPGGYLDNPEKIVANRIAAKLDWNINDKNKLSISYRYNQAERTNASQSNNNTINFYNNGYLMPNATHSTSIELKTNLQRGASNRLLITYVNIKDDRTPMGKLFPRVTVEDGTNKVIFGSENSSVANKLTQQNIALVDMFKFHINNHNFTVGTDNEFTYANNVFIRDNFGAYTYGSLNTFVKDLGPRSYSRQYSAIDNGIGDNTSAAAKFSTLRLGAFINDDIRINDHFSINLGLRLDATQFLTTPREDTFFNNRAIPAISQYYDMKGARSGQISSPSVALSPRLGFTYKVDEEGVVIRGGIGMFVGRVPLVWPGGVYNLNGVTVVEPKFVANPRLAADTTKNLPFRADPFNQYTSADVYKTSTSAKGEINLIAKNFKLPKTFRFSFAIDKKLGDGWTFTTEAIFTKAINEINYTNLNINPPTRSLVGADNRLSYWVKEGTNYSPAGSRSIAINGSYQNNPYSSVYLLSNNDGKKSYAGNVSFILDKTLKNGLAFNIAYTYGKSYVLNDGTSSQNSSQWRFMETVNGRNNMTLTESDFSMDHRVNAYLSKKFTYAHNKLATTITLVYNGQSGAAFSYNYQNSPIGDDGTGGTGTNDLIYVPRDASEIVFGNYSSQTNPRINQFSTLNAAQSADMWKALDEYISNDKYLNSRRGKYAERNGSRLPFTGIVDLKIAQDFNIKIAGKAYQIQLSYDMFNFTNFLKKEWGKQYVASNDNYQLITFLGLTQDGKPVYNFKQPSGKPYSLSDSVNPATSSRWTSQLGLRVTF